MKRGFKGFTVVELIIVIVVIGILASIVIVSYSGSQQRANRSSAESTLQQVKLKLGEYFTDNNRYPATKSDVSTYLQSLNQTTLKSGFDTISSDTTNFTYTPTPSGCATTGGTPCSSYTMTLQRAYWKGGTSDTSVVVTP